MILAAVIDAKIKLNTLSICEFYVSFQWQQIKTFFNKTTITEYM